MKILLDTNILVHAFNMASPKHQKAKRIVKRALQSKIKAYLTPQILYEFFSVITNPRQVEQPLSSVEAARICEDLQICHQIKTISPGNGTVSLVFSLVKQHGFTGAKIFDCIIAAVAKESEVDCIYTENISDFKVFGFLKIVNPLK